MSTNGEYIYYINEATESPSIIQDSEGSAPWTRTWQTSWQQSVHGCPVLYKIFITRDDGNGGTEDVDITDAFFGSYYTDVIFYTNTQAQVFDFATQTWWEQTDALTNSRIIQYDTSNSILPFDATVNVVVQDYTYDQEEW